MWSPGESCEYASHLHTQSIFEPDAMCCLLSNFAIIPQFTNPIATLLSERYADRMPSPALRLARSKHSDGAFRRKVQPIEVGWANWPPRLLHVEICAICPPRGRPPQTEDPISGLSHAPDRLRFPLIAHP